MTIRSYLGPLINLHLRLGMMKSILVLLVLFVGIVLSAPRKPTNVARSSCTDRYIWVADGSVDCKYLYTSSFWGLHQKPSYWCNDYSLTECCETCQRLRNEGVVN